MKRLRPPLFVTCSRPACGRLRQVRHPHDQRQGKYCSRKCAALVNRNIGKTTPERRAEIVAKSVRTRKQRVLARLDGLTPLQAFRIGYKLGLKSKHKQIRRFVEEIRAAKAAKEGRAA